MAARRGAGVADPDTAARLSDGWREVGSYGEVGTEAA